MIDRLLICGGREFKDEASGFAFLDQLAAGRQIAVVIEGGARGGDAIGRAWAESRCIEVVTFYADWSGLGRKAGPIRNHAMLTDGKPTLVAALPGGKGTAHMTRIAREAGVAFVEMNPSTLA